MNGREVFKHAVRRFPQVILEALDYNNIAIAAYYAKLKYKIKKCAVIDFDVHHGNGTQKMFWNDPNMFYASTHQEGIFAITIAT